jgi:hypothetical protein
MRMRHYRIAAILGLSFLLLVCSKTKNPVKNPAGLNVESLQSECKGYSKQGIGAGERGDTVIFSSHGDTISVLHQDAFYQCCARIKVEVVKTLGGFDLLESDTGEPCNCMCFFDITTEISGLPDGTYFIRVFDTDGDPVDSGTVDIPPKYGAFESFQSECKSHSFKAGGQALSDTLRDSVLVWFVADTVWVMHKNAFENCCSIILSQVERTPQGFDLFEYDTATDWCYCICYFDFTTTIYGVPAGVYLIRVFDTVGEFVGEAELVIPSP